MPIQSYLMMYFAGSGWQYGKRRISAMSNEQFNKLTPEELLKQHSIELKNMLPTLEKSLNDVTPLVRILIEQYGDFIREALKAMPAAIGNLFNQSGPGQSDIFGVRYDPGASRPGGNAQSTKEYWEQVAKNALKQAGSFYVPPIKTYPKYNPPKIKVNPKDFQTPIAQLSIAEQESQKLGKKKKAGQSQRLARNYLIVQIDQQAKLWKTAIKNGSSAATNYGIKLDQLQQSLVNLLARYDFG